MTRFPYPIGSIVTGTGFSGKVTATPGPYSVVVDDRLTVPTSLIQTDGGAVDVAPEPRESDGDQLAMF